MSWIPGWDTATSAALWSAIYFWLSIGALLALGICEVVSHKYAQRADELRATEQSEAQGRHSAETATLRGQLEAARVAAQPRHLLPQQQQILMTVAKPFHGTKINIFFEVGDGEGHNYAMDFLNVFQQAGWVTDIAQGMFGGPPLYGIELAAFQDDVDNMRPPAALDPLFKTLVEWRMIDRLDGTRLGEAGSIVLRIGKKPS